MNIIFDARQLAPLLSGFQALCGIHACVRGADGLALCEGQPRAELCARTKTCADGCAALSSEEDAGRGARFTQCRAGARIAALPLLSGERGEPLAWLCAGPFLDDAPAGVEDFARTPGQIPGEGEASRRSPASLRRLSAGERDALAAMLEALADSIRLRGLILPAGEGDLRRLERFLDEHYMEKLSLASVSAQLHIGRTRLCALAKELSGGGTLFRMIAQRRIEAAKALLIRSDRPISAIAEAVGISDYNYFSKIFRSAVGTSPSEFRKRARRDLDNMV